LQLPSVAGPLGTPFIELQSVDSTNNYALAQIHANLALPGTCYFAHEQTAGKGQRGKSWATEKGSDLAISIALKPQSLQAFQQFQLSACLALGTHHFLKGYTGEGLKIKWPNDVYWMDKKLAGILIESIVKTRSSGSSSWDWAVVGIGININRTKFPTDLKNAISLKQIAKADFYPIELARQLCQSLDHWYLNLLQQDFGYILNKYNDALYKKDKVVELRKGNRVFKTTIKGVSETGQLITQHYIEERFDFGEVEWVI
jgi:BirA family biotin operon repressor/biotin-[acetyl-CoA-carboxylase] ligase